MGRASVYAMDAFRGVMPGLIEQFDDKRLAPEHLRPAWDLFENWNKSHYPRSIVILGELPTSA